MVLRLVRVSRRLLGSRPGRLIRQMPQWALVLMAVQCSSLMRTLRLDIISFSLRYRLLLVRRISLWNPMFLCRRILSLTSWGVDLPSRQMVAHHLEVDQIKISGVQHHLRNQSPKLCLQSSKRGLPNTNQTNL